MFIVVGYSDARVALLTLAPAATYWKNSISAYKCMQCIELIAYRESKILRCKLSELNVRLAHITLYTRMHKWGHCKYKVKIMMH